MFNKNINKSIDSYLNTDYSRFKKYERINFLINEISRNIDQKKNYELLDIGCSKGELIYILKEKFSNIKFTGLEYSNELLKIAKNEPFLKDVVFLNDDARTFDINKKFDFIVMSGVISIFDEIEAPIKRIINHLKGNGVGLIFGAFNKDDIDVIIRYKNHYKKSKEWESGWNLFSLNTVKKVLTPFSKKIDVIDFKIKRNLKKKENPVTSYTVDIKDSNERLTLTGGGIVRDFHLIKFIKI